VLCSRVNRTKAQKFGSVVAHLVSHTLCRVIPIAWFDSLSFPSPLNSSTSQFQYESSSKLFGPILVKNVKNLCRGGSSALAGPGPGLIDYIKYHSAPRCCLIGCAVLRCAHGVRNRRDELQRLENQLGRAVTGNFRTANLGVVMAESGLRPAESLLNNRSRRHVLRLMSLPKGNQAKSLPGNNTPMGQRLVHLSASRYSGRVEEIYLPEGGPAELGAHASIADAEWAEQEAGKADFQPRLVLWTDGSRDENGAVGYAVAWRKGRSWEGRKTHMGFYQEAYGAECAAIARALKVAAERAKRR